MSKYFEYVSQELINKLSQVKTYITKHNPTTGLLAEEILRSFLRDHLPKLVSVEQGFILDKSGKLSKQCDIIIYDSQMYAPFYRINDIVVVPSEAVLAIIEVKTTITQQIFHDAISYFKSFGYTHAKKYLFIFNSRTVEKIGNYLHSYKHEGSYQLFDHDTFEFLPDEITGINDSYHLTKDYVITDRDTKGYSSHYYEDMAGTEINAVEIFYLSIYTLVESYIKENFSTAKGFSSRAEYHDKKPMSFFGVELFDI